MLRIRALVGGAGFGFNGLWILALTAYLAVVGVVVFGVQIQRDHFLGETSEVFSLYELPKDTTQQQAGEELQRIAEKSKANLYSLSSRRDAEGVLHLVFLAFVGDPPALGAGGAVDFSRVASPAFGPRVQVEVKPYSEVVAARKTEDYDLRGFLQVAGNSTATQRLFLRLDTQGFKFISPEQISPYPSLHGLLFEFDSLRIRAIAVFMALLGLVVATMHRASRRHQIVAIRQSWGRSPWLSAGREYAQTLLWFTGIALALGLLATWALYSYNGLRRYDQILAAALLLVALGLVAVLLAQTISLLVLRSGSVGQALKGRRPVKMLAVVALAAQGLAVYGGFQAATHVLWPLAELNQRLQYVSRWSQVEPPFTSRFSTAKQKTAGRRSLRRGA